MRPNSAKRKLQAGESVTCGWLSIPSSYSAEIVSRQGFDCVNVDLQHAMTGFETAVTMLQAIATTDAIPLARVGSRDPEPMMKLLDAGAYGIICPMISTAGEAESFVDACRYPPVGSRSYGPARGLLYGGPDYVTGANDEILTIGMIETRQGVENVDAIAAVAQLDALFIGPNDLCMDFGKAPKAESDDPEVVSAIARILEAGSRAGKAVGIFCSSADAAVQRRAEGFRFLVPGSDANILMAVAREAVTKLA